MCVCLCVYCWDICWDIFGEKHSVCIDRISFFFLFFFSWTEKHFALQSKSHFVTIKMKNVRGRLNHAEHELDLLVQPGVFQLSSMSERVGLSAADHRKVNFNCVLKMLTILGRTNVSFSLCLKVLQFYGFRLLKASESVLL